MADLSYSDVQRAVRDAVQNIQVNMQKLTTNVGMVTMRSDRIELIEATLRDMQRSMQLLQVNLNAVRLNGGPGDPRVTQMVQDMADLKIRFGAIERFIAQAGQYIRLKLEEEAEDQQYRNP